MTEREEMVSAKPISGFPEWLPEEKMIEKRCIDAIAKIFEGFGYTPLETAAVERTEVIASKGVEQKEIYNLRRYHASDDEENRYSLHFDLTVPFARYVAMNQGKLVFPFKRYQIQKVWRGERPAQGRFREFYQCDIDVVGLDQLPTSYDAELLEVMGRVFSELDIGQVTFRLNHRKLLEGFYQAIGIEEDARAKVLLEVDKLDKVGGDGVKKQLLEMNIDEAKIERIIAFASEKAELKDIESALKGFEVDSDCFNEGVEEFLGICHLLPVMSGARVTWDGSITRGLNYYTGVIFETSLEGAEELGSICSGGRYDDLASKFTRVKLPGVGISIGLTRLLSFLFSKKKWAEGEASSPSQILLSVIDEKSRPELIGLAAVMRSGDARVELAPPSKLKKQFNYANRKMIPHVVVPNDDGTFEWKNMTSGDQEKLSKEALLERCKSLDGQNL